MGILSRCDDRGSLRNHVRWTSRNFSRLVGMLYRFDSEFDSLLATFSFCYFIHFIGLLNVEHQFDVKILHTPRLPGLLFSRQCLFDSIQSQFFASLFTLVSYLSQNSSLPLGEANRPFMCCPIRYLSMALELFEFRYY